MNNQTKSIKIIADDDYFETDTIKQQQQKLKGLFKMPNQLDNLLDKINKQREVVEDWNIFNIYHQKDKEKMSKWLKENNIKMINNYNGEKDKILLKIIPSM